MEKAYIYKTNLGRFLMLEDGTAITGLELIIEEEDELTNEQILVGYEVSETDRIKEAAMQLFEYLDGVRKTFDIKINPQGTEFQKKVWQALRAIPYGETRTYKQIAEAVGNPKASRAVGMANNKNPIICIIPCHRVIGANGKLVGFACGLDVKEKLLRIENKNYDKRLK
jgi:O-6-methylguanine DNA methyltransferase